MNNDTANYVLELWRAKSLTSVTQNQRVIDYIAINGRTNTNPEVDVTLARGTIAGEWKIASNGRLVLNDVLLTIEALTGGASFASANYVAIVSSKAWDGGDISSVSFINQGIVVNIPDTLVEEGDMIRLKDLTLALK